MTRPPNNSWQYLPPVNSPGSLTTAGGGTSPHRDVLDARRQGRAAPFTPSAQYPAGYLGTVPSRREDRLLNHVKVQLTKRPYNTERGIHKVDRIPVGDYVWPEWFNPQMGLRTVANQRRHTPRGMENEVLAHEGKNQITSPAELDRIAKAYGYNGASPSQYTANRLKNLGPSWR